MEHDLNGNSGEDAFAPVRAFVERILVEIARDEIDLPHIVVQTDASTSTVRYLGPFDSAIAALEAADAEERRDSLGAGGGIVAFQVAPLHPIADNSPTGTGLRSQSRD